MSYFAYLKSLAKAQLKEEVEKKVMGAEETLLSAPARRRLLTEDDPHAWDSLDEVDAYKIEFHEDRRECVAQATWETFSSGDEDDERTMGGHTTACLKDDGTILFSDTSAELDGEAPKASPPYDDEPHSKHEQEMRQDELDRAQDEQDYTEYLTKD